MDTKFRLTESFLEKYKHKKPNFGFNGLGELVYLRTYSRIKANGDNEKWWETVQRVVEGTFNMQKKWIEHHRLGWNSMKSQKSAQEMYDRMYSMKFLPPGRGLWAMGSPITEERNLYAALNNCAFVSTSTIKEDLSKAFCFLMDMSMLGVGVGFDVKGEGKITIYKPTDSDAEPILIADTREAWVDATKQLIDSYFLGTKKVVFDYSSIRPAGVPIKGFGGVSSGPEPLIKLHEMIRKVLAKNINKPITVTAITDIMNLIGKCVVAGNVRRTAEIVFGDYNSEEYLDLKNYKVNPDREDFGWTSNNSIFCDIGMDYSSSAERTKINGEPGYAWLENMQGYSRMNNGKDNKDHRVEGGNPCLEQSLESYELCCLVETFPHNHESLEDYLITLKYAYLYAKTVTLGETHWPDTNRVMLRNRRIGCSMSGIVQFIGARGIHELKKWCEEGYSKIEYYDAVYSDWLAIPKSIKKTSIKPSGTVSLLAGATPGVHFPENVYYIRRMRLSKHSDLLAPLKEAGYTIEACVGSEDSTMVVEVPVKVGDNIRSVKDVSIWEQIALAAFMQKYWADNQVSCTVTFTKKEADQIQNVLNFYQYQLKGISFLPLLEHGGAYKQMPYESITSEKYDKMVSEIKTVKYRTIKNEEADVEKFCANDVCELRPKKI
jgi:ribonucleoside-triphosphate reductase (thioredoxin)